MNDTKINKITVAQGIYAFELLREWLDDDVLKKEPRPRGFKGAKAIVIASIVSQFLGSLIDSLKANKDFAKFFTKAEDMDAAKEEIKEELREQYRG